MHRWVAAALTALALSVFPVHACAQEATFTSSLRIDTEEGTFQLQHTLDLPLARFGGPRGVDSAPAQPGGMLFLRHTLEPDGSTRWGASLTAAAASWSGRLFIHEPHETSPDPFRLYHASVRTDDAVGAALSVRSVLGVSALYVDRIPLRGLAGPLLSLRVERDGWPLRIGAVAYGTPRLRHHFLVVDGATQLGGVRAAFGAARQSGVELAESGGALVRRNVDEQAFFARLEAAFGRSRAWLLVHDTSAGFRSLAASSYPFRRGAWAVEGRWQWRPATSRLLSVYFQHSRQGGGTEDEVQLGFSSMPRGRWGWRLDVEASWSDGFRDDYGWAVTLTNPDRRFEQHLAFLWDAAGQIRRRLRAQWEEETWRIRLSADDGLPAWRLEARWSPGGWEAAVVFKQRIYADGGTVSWLHAALTYDVPGFGQWWIQWRESDNGRLDVGWSRPATLGAGVRVFF